MIKFNNFAYMSAIALIGAVGFTACSSDDDITDPNPTFDGESVKTQFAISVPSANPGTRLGEDIVQGQNPAEFRGMQNIRLIPFIADGDPLSIDGTDKIAQDLIPLGSISDDGLQANGSYRVYNDVQVPLNINYFLFYGEALETADGSLVNGSLRPSFEVGGWPTGQTLSNVTFDLESILGTQTVSAAQTALAAMLNDIASATGTTGDNTAWSAATAGSDLKKYYDNFITLKAGSANSIKAALADLYGAMQSDRVTPDIDGLKAAIIAKIETYFSATETPTGSGIYTLAYNAGTSVSDYAEFPSNLGLPDGAMQLSNTAGTFAYTSPTISTTGDNVLQQTAYADYVYPASLYYTVQTPIKTQNSILTNNGVYNGSPSTWSDVLNLYRDAGTSVSSTTQSIALVNPVNYAVASFNLYVRFADEAIHDNGANWPTGAPIGEIAVNIPDDGFPLTGILIGDQKQVNWDFKTNIAAGSKTIYDASTGVVKVKKSQSTPSSPTAYTLALETEEGTAATEGVKTVRFALEMENTSGASFVGADGIVPAGGKFYLVGSLETETTDNKKGEEPVLKVFEQDHKTVARVTINSLKSAYNCIPDLRSPRLELGLSVDLEWQQGLVNDVEIN